MEVAWADGCHCVLRAWAVGRGVLLGGWTVAKAASWRDESPVGVMAAVEVGDMRWWLMLRLELVLHVH